MYHQSKEHIFPVTDILCPQVINFIFYPQLIKKKKKTTKKFNFSEYRITATSFC